VRTRGRPTPGAFHCCRPGTRGGPRRGHSERRRIDGAAGPGLRSVGAGQWAGGARRRRRRRRGGRDRRWSVGVSGRAQCQGGRRRGGATAGHWRLGVGSRRGNAQAGGVRRRRSGRGMRVDVGVQVRGCGGARRRGGRRRGGAPAGRGRVGAGSRRGGAPAGGMQRRRGRRGRQVGRPRPGGPVATQTGSGSTIPAGEWHFF
jgi:hypothetical protein